MTYELGLYFPRLNAFEKKKKKKKKTRYIFAGKVSIRIDTFPAFFFFFDGDIR